MLRLNSKSGIILRKKKKWSWLKAFFYIFVFLFLVIESFIVKGFFEKGSKDLDYIIILGAKVNKTTPSLSLQYRIEEAGNYLMENEGTVAILSGGQGDDEEISEAQCMYEQLTDMGIMAERLIMENKSTSTSENIKYSSKWIENKNCSIGIVTNNFHIFRAVGIAKKLGYKKVEGIAAKSVWWMQPKNMIRECLAIIKDVVVGNL